MYLINKLLLFVIFFTVIVSGCDTGKPITDINLDVNNGLKLFTSIKKLNQKSRNESSRPYIANTRIADISDNIKEIFSTGSSFLLSIDDGVEYSINNTIVTERHFSKSLKGTFDSGYGSIQMVKNKNGITGTVLTRKDLFKFESSGNESVYIERIDESLMRDHPKDYKSPAYLDTADTSRLKSDSIETNYTASMSVSPNGGPTHGVLVAYTQNVKNSVNDIQAHIQLAIDETNVSFSNSNMLQNVYLAGTEEVRYDESGSSLQNHLDALTDYSDGEVDNIRGLRGSNIADIVILMVVQPGSGCGIANGIYPSRLDAYAVVDYDCATGYYSFGHEIGHLLGARHDTYIDPATTPFSYGHGYVDPNDNWRTIMAYGAACNGCDRKQYWSTPDAVYPRHSAPANRHRLHCSKKQSGRFEGFWLSPWQ